ncbi:PTS glucitol/sorbitol transporter subunit IIA [Caproiciproducens sp. CPB-2]|uniref:PTS glucitol/sorbitol transporter subunit IIA n=1 Tax=unclassified Caproiciproducens TaxID=2643836 RepID=UPI0023DA7BDF|nr:PTS glucitol/sorbitol transporter subunit IIA [Caproiciproducens sp. CPB-2]MDF1493408.1 PTS glucitol/sorbitol transporter subunit IIA [Caproiciproducens sp. CPB-2]
MFKTTVTAIGRDAIFDESPMLVLFGKDCPEELQDACIIHEFKGEQSDGILRPGGHMLFDDKEYTVEQVGEVANENFSRLGHMTLIFDPSEDVLPGAVVLSPAGVPEVRIGSSIVFM